MALEDFILGYKVCALWSSMDESDENTGGDPLDENYGPEDISEETAQQMKDDCAMFYEANWELWLEDDVDDESAGHDFWLTRNGHGAGFWDGDYPKNGDTLTELCKAFKEVNLYVGDDGKIYHQ